MANVFSLFHIFLIISFFYKMFQATHAIRQKQSSGLSLKMVHWNSPELPSHRPNLTHEEIMDELFRISEFRLKALEQLVVFNSSRSSNEVIRPKLVPTMLHGLYLVQVGIGTFETNPSFKTYYLLLDTSTDQTWTQCHSCNPCFPQRGPYFPWSQSHTYRKMPCTHCPACQHGQCVFNKTHGVDDYIIGAKARDAFTFETPDRLVIPVEFICVFGSRGFLGGNLPRDNVVSGVLGLSPVGYTNLMHRMPDTRIKNGRFSYCLQPLDQPIEHPMYLRFGRDIPRLPEYALRGTTSILRAPNPQAPSLYYLELLDLGVEKTRLEIDPQVFRMKPDGKGGCFLDSATPMSYIPRVAYDRLEQSYAQHFESKNPGRIQRVHSPFPVFPFCYEQITHQLPTYATVTFHFVEGANLEVHKPMGRYIYNGHTLHCLQIHPSNNGLTVLGAMQQVNHRFVIDNKLHKLHFWPQNCALYN